MPSCAAQGERISLRMFGTSGSSRFDVGGTLLVTNRRGVRRACACMRLHAAARCRVPPQVTNYRLVYASNKGTVVQVRHYPAARSKPGRDSLQLSSYLAGRWMRAASAQGCSAGAAAVAAADRAAGNALGQMEGRQGHRLGRADAGAPCSSPLPAPGRPARNGARAAEQFGRGAGSRPDGL